MVSQIYILNFMLFKQKHINFLFEGCLYFAHLCTTDVANKKIFYSLIKNQNNKFDSKEIMSNLVEDLRETQSNFESKNTKSVAHLIIEFFQFYFLNPDSTLPTIGNKLLFFAIFNTFL